jgi:hypothetical protein
MYILIVSNDFSFFRFFTCYGDRKFYQKFKRVEKCKNIHQSTHFLMVIPTMINLLYKVLFFIEENENYRHNSCYFDQNSVKTIFLDEGKKRKKRIRNLITSGMTNRIIDSIVYIEKLDRFTKSTYTHHSRRDSKRHHQ